MAVAHLCHLVSCVSLNCPLANEGQTKLNKLNEVKSTIFSQNGNTPVFRYNSTQVNLHVIAIFHLCLGVKAELSGYLFENSQCISRSTSCSCKWKPSVHVAVQKSLTCLRANENWDFNLSDLRTGWRDTPSWNCNGIIQFVPVNTFTAVRSVSCIYLAGITLKLAPCGPPLVVVIKRSGAVLKGLVLCASSLSFSWVFLRPLQSPEPRPRVLVGAHQCSQLVSTSWPLALRNPFFFLFLLLAKYNTFYRTWPPSAGGCSLTPEGKHGKCSLPLSFRNVRKMIGLFYLNVWSTVSEYTQRFVRILFSFRLVLKMCQKNAKISAL